MSFALLFSGQGQQHAAMLPWLARDGTVVAVEAMLGSDWRERLADPDWAGRNAHAQPLLTGLALAAWTQLAMHPAPHLPPHLPPPVAVAGYSVGELAACAAAGAYDNATAIDLARQRAALMDEPIAAGPTGLLGLSGLAAASLDRLCVDFELAVAIRNGVDSVVVGGRQAALPAAADAARRQGAHVTPLNVRVASHTPWMAAAAAAFAELLAPLPLAAPRVPLFSNVDGRISTVAQLKQALSRQIAHTVRWDDCMENIAARQPRCVLEIGPGQALARMWNQRFPQIPARSADEFRSARAIVEWVARRSSA